VPRGPAPWGRDGRATVGLGRGEERNIPLCERLKGHCASGPRLIPDDVKTGDSFGVQKQNPESHQQTNEVNNACGAIAVVSI